MTPSPSSSTPPGAAPLPPLPDLSGGSKSAGAAPGGNMASLISGLAPVKMEVDNILMSCKKLVQSGAIPGAEQPCSQIVALATSLLPMAAQQMMQPGGQGPQAAGPGPVGPPPGGPQGPGPVGGVGQ